MGHPHLRPGRAVSARPATQQRHSLCHITSFSFCPALVDRSDSTPERQTLLEGYRIHFVRLPLQSCVVSDERKQPAAKR